MYRKNVQNKCSCSTFRSSLKNKMNWLTKQAWESKNGGCYYTKTAKTDHFTLKFIRMSSLYTAMNNAITSQSTRRKKTITKTLALTSGGHVWSSRYKHSCQVMNKASDLITGEANVSSLNIWCPSHEFHFGEEKLTVDAEIQSLSLL